MDQCESDTFRQAKAIFLDALDVVDPRDVETLIQQRCGKSSAVGALVRELFQAHRTTDAMLDAVDDALAVGEPPEPLAAGQVIGRYEVDRLIGEGGMGMVYRAEQREPIRRFVALKVIRQGIDTREVLSRFRIEQQVLTRLQHPHIARVLDAGQTDKGHPYFVMELVDGVPITAFCDRHRLSLAARLKLFQKLCATVAFAHQKGVIHRDLKPNNVLVSDRHGDEGPKVIDFGLAKAIDGSLGNRTRVTRLKRIVGTPPYMSPEQARGADIDTRTDVFALGVLLYELLTGIKSADPTSHGSSSGHSDTDEPFRSATGRPSRRFGALDPSQQAEISAHRSTDAKHLLHALRGDLDWIVLKAVAADRERRYESVAALSRDVERYLSDEPIDARPPSRWYEFRKLVQRNRAAVAAIGAVIASLLAVVGISVSQATLARRAERRVEALLEQTRATQAEKEALLYAADIRSAAQALEEGDVGEAVKLLERQRPRKDSSHGEAVDRRGLEWFFLLDRAQIPHDRLQLTAGRLEKMAAGRGGQVVAAADDGTSAWVFDWAQRAKPPIPRTATAEISALALDPDASRIAVGSVDGAVEVRDTDNWALIHSDHHAERIVDLHFAPDGNGLIVSTNTPHVEVVGLSDGEIRRTLDHHGDAIEALSLASDGQTLVAASDDGTASVWRWQTGQLLHQTPPADFRLTSVAISSDGEFFVDSDVKGGLRVTRTDSWATTQAANVPSAIQAIAISPDDRRLAVGCRTGILYLFRVIHDESDEGLEAGRIRLNQPSAFLMHQQRISDICWLDDRRLATISRDGSFVVSTVDPDQERFPKDAFASHRLAIAPDGGWIIAHDLKRVQLIDVATGKSRALPAIHSDMDLGGRSFTPDSRTLMIATADGRLASADVDSPENVHWREAPLGADFSRLRFSDGGERLMLFSDRDDRVVVVDYPSFRLLFHAASPDAANASLSPDGNYLVTSYQGDLIVYHVDSGEVIAESVEHHTETINDVRFGPDGDWIATTSDDRTVRIWNPWGDSPPELVGVHPGGVPRSLSISSDGRTLVTSSRSGQVWLWNVPARQKLFAIAAHPAGYYFSALSKNDRILVTLDQTGQIRWLDLAR